MLIFFLASWALRDYEKWWPFSQDLHSPPYSIKSRLCTWAAKALNSLAYRLVWGSPSWKSPMVNFLGHQLTCKQPMLKRNLMDKMSRDITLTWNICLPYRCRLLLKERICKFFPLRVALIFEKVQLLGNKIHVLESCVPLMMMNWHFTRLSTLFKS